MSRPQPPEVDDSSRRARLALGLLVAGSLGFGCTAVTTVDLFPEKAAAGKAGQPSGAEAGKTSNGTASGLGASSGPWLVNRYDFSGTGTVVVDSLSGKNGEIIGGAALDGTGQLSLTGDTQQYVKLPPWLISSMKSVTIVTWFTWNGGRPWQSVFNFGYNKSGSSLPSEDVGAEVFFTPLTVAVTPTSSFHMAIVFDQGQDSIDHPEAFPTNQPMAVAAVYDGELRQISLFYNGILAEPPKALTIGYSLSELKDSNCWLGQSQWAHDVAYNGNFRGIYDEFRIYSGALTAQQVANLSLTDPYRM